MHLACGLIAGRQNESNNANVLFLYWCQRLKNLLNTILNQAIEAEKNTTKEMLLTRLWISGKAYKDLISRLERVLCMIFDTIMSLIDS